MSAPIDSLQIGMHGCLARPDGLDRMLQTLVHALPGQGVNVRGPGAEAPLARTKPDGMTQPLANAKMGLNRLRQRTHGHAHA